MTTTYEILSTCEVKLTSEKVGRVFPRSRWNKNIFSTYFEISQQANTKLIKVCKWVRINSSRHVRNAMRQIMWVNSIHFRSFRNGSVNDAQYCVITRHNNTTHKNSRLASLGRWWGILSISWNVTRISKSQVHSPNCTFKLLPGIQYKIREKVSKLKFICFKFRFGFFRIFKRLILMFAIISFFFHPKTNIRHGFRYNENHNDDNPSSCLFENGNNRSFEILILRYYNISEYWSQ